MAMFWGDNQISDFESVVKAGYANFILGFNEYATFIWTDILL